MIVEETILNRLYQLGTEMKLYVSERMREKTKARVLGLSESNGYSFEHWEKTGYWKKYYELETVCNAPVKPFQMVERMVETKVETVEQVEKSENKPFKSTFVDETLVSETVETKCITCGETFGNVRRNKRFCSVKCKSEFHNLKRKQ